MPRVLVVDDDPTVAEVVIGYLRRSGLETDYVSDGLSALESATSNPPDLVVLDVMLPGMDGIEVCRRLRATSEIPIVMLTALGGEVDRVLGLEVGADDYVTKPFSPRELSLRVHSVLRRTSGPATPPIVERVVHGDLSIDLAARRVLVKGVEVSLTAREFDLLAYLAQHPDRAFTREQLMEAVWGWSFGDQSTVTVHVRRVREKTEEDPTDPQRLLTVWGVGYRWAPAPTDDAPLTDTKGAVRA